MKRDSYEKMVLALYFLGLLGAAILLVAMLTFRQVVPKEDVNLYPEAHKKAMQVERQAIKDGKP